MSSFQLGSSSTTTDWPASTCSSKSDSESASSTVAQSGFLLHISWALLQACKIWPTIFKKHFLSQIFGLAKFLGWNLKWCLFHRFWTELQSHLCDDWWSFFYLRLWHWLGFGLMRVMISIKQTLNCSTSLYTLFNFKNFATAPFFICTLGKCSPTWVSYTKRYWVTCRVVKCQVDKAHFCQWRSLAADTALHGLDGWQEPEGWMTGAREYVKTSYFYEK